MHYRKLGKTDIDVSLIGLGTMTWGEQNDQEEGFNQMDYALDQGINLFDVAEMYPVPPRGETSGRTETIIGNYLTTRKNRDKIILATKVASRAEWLPHIRDGNICLDAKNINAAIEGSLKRLQTDYVDLYQLHWPDRSTNFFGLLGYQHDEEEVTIPLEETFQALKALVTAGKVRHIGVSNETPWGVMTIQRITKELGMEDIVSIQNPYNLLNRTYEVGLAEVSHREQISLLAYSPLAFGVLTGKYLNNQRPEGARLTLFSRFSRYNNPQAQAATQAYYDLAQQHGLKLNQMALAFVSRQPFVTSNLIGATSMEQLKSNIDSINLELSEDVLAGIEAIHEQQPNPSP